MGATDGVEDGMGLMVAIKASTGSTIMMLVLIG